MADCTVKKIGEMEGAFGGGMRRARAELGVRSFGMQIEEFPPNFDQYPDHSHSDDGQEEVYVVMRGTAEIEIDGERIPLDPETIVRVGPGVSRRIFAGPEGVRVLALGGVPGMAYEAPAFSKLGAPDPGSA
jgi:mannose-6-phosphate isomerase-like protein (cupin superfamily)